MTRLRVVQGDITLLDTDAIVNAANNQLLPGGGVCGAIHRAGGPLIAEACRQIGTCPTGEAVVTTAGNLKARYVIHAVGPVWRGGGHGEEELLERTYINSLKRATELGLRSIAFPNISTGIYGFPKDRAACIAVNAVRNFVSGETSLKEVIFCCFDAENAKLYEALLKE
jgi:O-acetyl-ADP-ribose deacetylase (regulator of RNase III)